MCLIVPHLDIFVYKLSPLIESMNLIIRRLAQSLPMNSAFKVSNQQQKKFRRKSKLNNLQFSFTSDNFEPRLAYLLMSTRILHTCNLTRVSGFHMQLYINTHISDNHKQKGFHFSWLKRNCSHHGHLEGNEKSQPSKKCFSYINYHLRIHW